MKTREKTLSEQAAELISMFCLVAITFTAFTFLFLHMCKTEDEPAKNIMYSFPFKDADYGIFLLKNDSVAVQDETGYFEIMPLNDVADYIEKEQL